MPPVDYADIIDRDAQPVGPIHPGVILQEEFLEPLGLSAYALAIAISVPRNRITGIVHGERAITADTALRLARFFDMSPDFWLGLQMTFDLETTPRCARRPARSGSRSARRLIDALSPAK